MASKNNTSRRQFLVVTGGLALGAGVMRGAIAAGLPHLSEDDPTAKALRYVHDASTIDVASRGGADNRCTGCNFYKATDEAGWGSCTLFPGKAVNGDGWCSAWAKRAG